MRLASVHIKETACEDYTWTGEGKARMNNQIPNIDLSRTVLMFAQY